MRLLVIEDDEEFTATLRLWLPVLIDTFFFEALAFYPSLGKARSGIQDFRPDVILFDIHLPDGQAFHDASAWLMKDDMLLLCMTGHRRTPYIDDVLKRGVLAFIEKDDDFFLNLHDALLETSLKLRNRQQADYIVHYALERQALLHKVLEETKTQLATKERILELLRKLPEVSAADSEKSIPSPLTFTIRMAGETTTLVLSSEDILTAESDNYKVCILMSDSTTKYEISKSLTKLEELLPSAHFLRCHASHIVNMRHVMAFTATAITMRNGEVMPISRTYHIAVREALTSYFSKKK
jgi:DNA-binding LytR/AlgR family response regulator